MAGSLLCQGGQALTREELFELLGLTPEEYPETPEDIARALQDKDYRRVAILFYDVGRVLLERGNPEASIMMFFISSEILQDALKAVLAAERFLRDHCKNMSDEERYNFGLICAQMVFQAIERNNLLGGESGESGEDRESARNGTKEVKDERK